MPCQRPTRAWEALQLGNCGPPIETEAGWLVLTHGVGPMRTYRIGAILLDLEDPTRVLGRLRQPLLSPAADEQDGYVPNVVYSCGALVHADTLVLPYGIGDAAIGIATVPLAETACRPGSLMAGNTANRGRDTSVMRRNVAAELEVEITAATTLEFQIAVAPHPGDRGVASRCRSSWTAMPLQAMEISGVHGNRIHKLEVPAGYLSVEYARDDRRPDGHGAGRPNTTGRCTCARADTPRRTSSTVSPQPNSGAISIRRACWRRCPHGSVPG